MFFSNYLFP